MSDETEIRELIETWARAAHAGDLATVLADHDADIVMFDVPPPFEGLRGLEAYRDSWPPFFEWQRSGAVFDIEELEVVAGGDVAFAYALLRCGTPEEFAAEPHQRLRLTLGLRKRDGRWVVLHEHHSFPHTDQAPATAEGEVRKIYAGWSRDTVSGDLDGLMSPIAADVVSYEHAGPPEVVGRDAVREVCARGLAAGDAELDTPDLVVRVAGDLAVAWGLDRIVSGGKVMRSRGTRVFERREGRWQMTHQHLSLPPDDA